MDRPSTGTLLIDGEDTERLSERALTSLRLFKLGFVFQSFNLIPSLTATQNIALPLRLQGGLSRRESTERVEALLDRVGLARYGRNRPSELSGGQQQRVAVARALVGNPKLVLADEPTANLDSTTGAGIIRLLRDLCEKEFVTFIIATHDVAVMRESTRRVELRDGAICSDDELSS